MKIKNIVHSDSLYIWFILLIGGLFRFYNLAGKNFWYDEACSLSFAQYRWQEVISHRYMLKPVYFIMLKLWVGLFGTSEFVVRTLSVIFGWFSIFLIYKLGKNLFSKSIGLISALILSISPYHVYYSQQARNYSMFLFLSLLSMLIFLCLKKKVTRTISLLFILSNLLLIYTHPFGIFVLITQAVFSPILWGNREEKKKIFFLLTILFVCALPILIVFVNDSTNVGGNEINYISVPNINSIIETFEAFSYGGSKQGHCGLGFEINSSRLVIPRILTTIFLFIGIFGLLTQDKPRQKEESFLLSSVSKLLLLFWLSFTILTVFIFSKLFTPIYLTRYFITTSVPFYLIVARGITKIPVLVLKLAVTLIIIIFLLYSLNITYSLGFSNSWKELAVYIKSNIQDGDTIVLAPFRQIVPFWYYYHPEKERLKGIDVFGKKVGNKWESSFRDSTNLITGIELGGTKDIITRMTNKLKKEDIWLVVSPNWLESASCSLLKTIIEKTHIMKKRRYFEFDGVEVIHYTAID